MDGKNANYRLRRFDPDQQKRSTGDVFQKDLGPNAAKLTERMTSTIPMGRGKVSDTEPAVDANSKGGATNTSIRRP